MLGYIGGIPSNTLMQSVIPIQNFSYCGNYGINSTTQLCAGDTSFPRDSCQVNLLNNNFIFSNLMVF